MDQSSFPVSIIMEKRPSVSKWADAYWTVVGIIIGEPTASGKASTEKTHLHTRGEIEQYLYPGFSMRLYKDECESYYHNMVSPNPSCYVITDNEENAEPVPFKVSMSFDEAHAEQEGGKEVYPVEIPAEIYSWMEAFVIDNYFPEKKFKRKLNNWKKGGGNVRA